MAGSRLGQMMRSSRLSRGLTQEEVEARTGVSQTHISQIETGRTKRPEQDTLATLAALYDVPLNDLLVAAGWLVVEEVTVAHDEVRVEVRGTLPGRLRTTERSAEEGYAVVRVLPEMVGGASAPFALLVTDNAWRDLGIVAGNYVIVETPTEDDPADGSLVVLALDDEPLRLVRWMAEADGAIALHGPESDGMQSITRIKDWRERIRVVGIYVYHLPALPAPLSGSRRHAAAPDLLTRA